MFFNFNKVQTFKVAMALLSIASIPNLLDIPIALYGLIGVKLIRLAR